MKAPFRVATSSAAAPPRDVALRFFVPVFRVLIAFFDFFVVFVAT
ncbi:MAG TPA: hypothetical protein VMV18_09140 [bacterium]|nr:hypothetical protein [bacterium]